MIVVAGGGRTKNMEAEGRCCSIGDMASTTFASATASVVIACTYDPLGLQGPLQVWLNACTGFDCELSWVGYGMVTEALSDGQSAWCSNVSGLNVLLLRWNDLIRTVTTGEHAIREEGMLLIEALRTSCMRRRGPTVVLLPPVPGEHADGTASDLTAALRSIVSVRVIESEELRVSLDQLRRYHSAFLDRVAHSPYAPAACSVFAGRICRELARSVAPTKKVYCLDCDNTLWGGAARTGKHRIQPTRHALLPQ